MSLQDAISQGQPIPSGMLGELTESSALFPDTGALKAQFDADGYLFLRGLHDPDRVLAARAEVFGRLEAIGEIAPPAAEGIATGESHRTEAVADLGAFWRSVSEGPRLRAVTHGARIREIVGTVRGERVRPHDYIFLRPAPVGRSTGPHCDYPFFTRATEQVVTVWTALGPVPIGDGPLVVVEGSHRFADLVEATRGFDVARDSGRTATRAENHVAFARSRGARLLSADFGPGDIVIFGMFTWHGALDNHSACGRVRLSSDVRFQPVGAAEDPRYFGPDPGGTTGAGYGELNGAKPLTEPWHTR